jgi:pilus assembly protein CpaF
VSLSDRLAQARRERVGTTPAPTSDAGPTRARKHSSIDPFADLKRTVHTALLESLGPQLYDSRLTEDELASKVRVTLQDVLAQEETPLTVTDRARLAQEIADDILGYGPLEPFLRDPEITEVMVNGPQTIYIERAGKIYPAVDEGAPAPHDRQDRRPRRTPRGRGLAHGRRASP